MQLRRITSLLDPRFLFRPDVFIRACVRKLRRRPDNALVRTSWGDILEVNPRKFIGAHLYMRGVHELPVCEALLRLTDPGETVVDVGANIGVMTSLLSRRVGALGKVIAFEAHPVIAEVLRSNVKHWMQSNVQVVEAAVSKTHGFLIMQESEGCETNEGIAQVHLECPARLDRDCIRVRAVELDREFETMKLSVIKIDVEGHELAVLEGASCLLKKGAIRDIVFECTTDYPSPAHRFLLQYGYSVYRLGSGLFGPQLGDPSKANKGDELLADFVATMEPRRALNRLASRGWRALYSQGRNVN